MSLIGRTVERAAFLLNNLYKRYLAYQVRRQSATCGVNLKVNHRSKVTMNTHIGYHDNFNGIEIKGRGTVQIGDYFHSGTGCLIISQNHNYDFGSEIPYDSTYIYKDVIIEDFVWIGDRVIILGGAHIGEGAIIQAGSVVCGSIPSCAVAGGHPAKVFRYRDKEHYYQLKEQGKFH